MAFSRRSVLACSTAFVLTGGAARARPMDEVQESGLLRVAVYRDHFPYAFRRDGVLVGINVDFATEVARRLGLTLALQEQTAGESVADDLRVQIWRGSLFGGERADVMLHIPYSKTLKLQNPECVLFAPYHREVFGFARDVEQAPAADLADLPEAPIGVEIDSVPDFFLTSAFNGRLRPWVKHYPSAPDAAAALLRGEVAAALGPISEMSARMGDQAERFKLRPVQFGPGFPALWDVGLAAKENSRDLANAVTDGVTEMIADGTLDRIFARYGAARRPIPDDED